MKILFYILRNLHLPHLLPVYEWMIAHNNARSDISFSGSSYIPSEAGKPGYGLEPEFQQSLLNDGVKWVPEEWIADWRPDVIVMADADYRGGIHRVGAKMVNVNHGLISKGCFYSDSPLTRRENIAELICVPGPFHRDALKRTVYKPVLVSGLVKFDRIFNRELKREDVLEQWGIDTRKKVILFAPTFNRELSAVPLVTDSVRNWVDDNMHLLIKLHGMSPPEWVELYRLITENDPRITLIEDHDLTPCLVAADVMVSDVSSAFMEFIALDKPVVLVNNPLRTRFIGFDPRDIEYSWRDVGVEVNDASEIPGAIRRALDNPTEKADKRRLYGSRLIGPRDGRASERIGSAIYALDVSFQRSSLYENTKLPRDSSFQRKLESREVDDN